MFRFINYDTHQLHALICREFENSSKWEIIPFFDDKKHIKLIWHPSLSLYNYLKLHQEEHTPSIILYKGRNHDGHWRLKIDVTFHDNSHSIEIIWYPRSTDLTHDDVNQSIAGLTAQHLFIKLRVPFTSGLARHTRSSWAYGRRRYSNETPPSNYNFPTYPIWRAYELNCYISSERGIYARAPGESYADRQIIPLKCYSSPCRIYKTYNRGWFRVNIDGQNYSVWPGNWEHLCTVNRTTFRTGFKLIDNFVYLNGRMLKDASTDEPVSGDMNVVPRRHYYLE